MEQNNPASATPALPQPASPDTASPETTSSLPDDRCGYLSRSGRRCRAKATDPVFRLCGKHSSRIAPDPESASVSIELFGEGAPAFGSVEEINSVLTNLVILVAQGRLSSRRAGVIVYALSFILRGLQVIDKKAAEGPQEFVIDIDSAAARRAQALQTQTHP